MAKPSFLRQQFVSVATSFEVPQGATKNRVRQRNALKFLVIFGVRKIARQFQWLRKWLFKTAKPCTPVQFWSWPPAIPLIFSKHFRSQSVPRSFLLPFCYRIGFGVRFAIAICSWPSTNAAASSCIPGMTWL
jgi:hypothetical protein